MVSESEIQVLINFVTQGADSANAALKNLNTSLKAVGASSAASTIATGQLFPEVAQKMALLSAAGKSLGPQYAEASTQLNKLTQQGSLFTKVFTGEGSKANIGQILNTGSISEFRDRFKTEMGMVQQIAVKTGSSLGAASNEITGLTDPQRWRVFQHVNAEAMYQAGLKATSFGKTLQWTGRQMTMGLTLPIVLGMSTMVKSFLKVNQAQTEFAKYIVQGGASAKTATAEVASLNDELLAISKSTGLYLDQTTQLAAAWKATGVQSNEEVLALTDLTAQLVLLTQGEIDQAGAMELVRSVMRTWNLTVDQTQAQMEKLALVASETSLTMGEIAQAIPLASSAAQLLGIDASQLAAILSGFREKGISATQSANALRVSLSKLVNPTQTVVDAWTHLTKIIPELEKFKGTSLTDFLYNADGTAKGAEGLVSMAKSIFAEGVLTQRQSATFLAQVFGARQFSNMDKLFKSLNDPASQLSRSLADVASSAKASAVWVNQLAVVQDSAAFAATQMRVEFSAIMATLGATIWPYVEKIGRVLLDIMNKFANASEVTKNFVVGVTIALASLGPATFIVAQLIEAFGMLKVAVSLPYKALTFMKVAEDPFGLQKLAQTDFGKQNPMIRILAGTPAANEAIVASQTAVLEGINAQVAAYAAVGIAIDDDIAKIIQMGVVQTQMATEGTAAYTLAQAGVSPGVLQKLLAGAGTGPWTKESLAKALQTLPGSAASLSDSVAVGTTTFGQEMEKLGLGVTQSNVRGAFVPPGMQGTGGGYLTNKVTQYRQNGQFISKEKWSGLMAKVLKTFGVSEEQAITGMADGTIKDLTALTVGGALAEVTSEEVKKIAVANEKSVADVVMGGGAAMVNAQGAAVASATGLTQQEVLAVSQGSPGVAGAVAGGLATVGPQLEKDLASPIETAAVNASKSADTSIKGFYNKLKTSIMNYLGPSKLHILAPSSEAGKTGLFSIIMGNPLKTIGLIIAAIGLAQGIPDMMKGWADEQAQAGVVIGDTFKKLAQGIGDVFGAGQKIHTVSDAFVALGDIIGKVGLALVKMATSFTETFAGVLGLIAVTAKDTITTLLQVSMLLNPSSWGKAWKGFSSELFGSGVLGFFGKLLGIIGATLIAFKGFAIVKGFFTSLTIGVKQLGLGMAAFNADGVGFFKSIKAGVAAVNSVSSARSFSTLSSIMGDPTKAAGFSAAVAQKAGVSSGVAVQAGIQQAMKDTEAEAARLGTLSSASFGEAATAAGLETEQIAEIEAAQASAAVEAGVTGDATVGAYAASAEAIGLNVEEIQLLEAQMIQLAAPITMDMELFTAMWTENMKGAAVSESAIQAVTVATEELAVAETEADAMNPFTAIIVAIGVVIALIVIFTNKIDAMANSISDHMEAAQGAVKDLNATLDDTSSTIEQIKNGFGGLDKVIQDTLGQVTGDSGGWKDLIFGNAEHAKQSLLFSSDQARYLADHQPSSSRLPAIEGGGQPDYAGYAAVARGGVAPVQNPFNNLDFAAVDSRVVGNYSDYINKIITSPDMLNTWSVAGGQYELKMVSGMMDPAQWSEFNSFVQEQLNALHLKTPEQVHAAIASLTEDITGLRAVRDAAMVANDQAKVAELDGQIAAAEVEIDHLKTDVGSSVWSAFQGEKWTNLGAKMLSAAGLDPSAMQRQGGDAGKAWNKAFHDALNSQLGDLQGMITDTMSAAFDMKQSDAADAFAKAQQAQLDNFDKSSQHMMDALQHDADNKTKAIDRKIAAIQKQNDAEAWLLQKQQWRQQQEQLMQTASTDAAINYMERMKAIDEGRFNDARILELQGLAQAQANNQAIKDLNTQVKQGKSQHKDDKRVADLNKKKDQIAKDLALEQKALQKSLDAQKQALQDSLDAQKKAFDLMQANAKSRRDHEFAEDVKLWDGTKSGWHKMLQALKADNIKFGGDMATVSKLFMDRYGETLKGGFKEAISMAKTQADQVQGIVSQSFSDTKLAAMTPEDIALYKVLGDYYGALGDNPSMGAAETSAWFAKIANAMQGADKAAQSYIPQGFSAGKPPPVGQSRHSGGPITGSSRAGDVPITAQEGEYVIKRSRVQQLGHHFLDRMNRGGGKKYHTGGLVDSSQQSAYAGMLSGGLLLPAMTGIYSSAVNAMSRMKGNALHGAGVTMAKTVLGSLAPTLRGVVGGVGRYAGGGAGKTADGITLAMAAMDRWMHNNFILTGHPFVNVRPIGTTGTLSQHSYGNADDLFGSLSEMDNAFATVVRLSKNNTIRNIGNIIHWPVASPNPLIWNHSYGLHQYVVPPGGSDHANHIHIDMLPQYAGTPPGYPVGRKGGFLTRDSLVQAHKGETLLNPKSASNINALALALITAMGSAEFQRPQMMSSQALIREVSNSLKNNAGSSAAASAPAAGGDVNISVNIDGGFYGDESSYKKLYNTLERVGVKVQRERGGSNTTIIHK